MAVIKSASYTTPDGVERALRFTQAAQFRASSEKERAGAVPDYFIAWAMMFDEDDNPPAFKNGPRTGQTMTAGWLGANLSPLEQPKLRAAIAEATTGAALEKKIIEKMEQLANEEIQKLAGAISGVTLESISGSQEVPPVASASPESSGGSPPENMPLSKNGT